MSFTVYPKNMRFTSSESPQTLVDSTAVTDSQRVYAADSSTGRFLTLSEEDGFPGVHAGE